MRDLLREGTPTVPEDGGVGAAEHGVLVPALRVGEPLAKVGLEGRRRAICFLIQALSLRLCVMRLGNAP